jgi:extracellular elastinolytic metalloproteinase
MGHGARPRVVVRGVMRRVGATVIVGFTIVALALPAPALGVGQVLDGQQGLGDVDKRTGRVQPSAAQRSMADALGANVTWNRFGTPDSLIHYGGYLATGLSGADAATAARTWVAAHKALFRLTGAASADLELVNDSTLAGSNGHAVLFRQRFGGVPAAQDGMITVGIVGTRAAGWKIAYVSSSSVGSQAAPAAPTLSATDAWLIAARDAGQQAAAGTLAKVHVEGTWTVFTVTGYAQAQRARVRALAIPGAGVRSVFEANVLNVLGGSAVAYTSFVDGIDGKVWFRQNRVDDLAEATPADPYNDAAAPMSGQFQGATGAGGACGPEHPFDAPAGTATIDVTASATIPANDIVLNLIYKVTNTTVGTSDEATSPEAIHYAPVGGVPAGQYAAQVCPFTAGADPIDYAGFYITQDAGSAQVPYPPEWKFFLANPPLTYANTDTRTRGCWERLSTNPGCTLSLRNMASRAPWDFEIRTNTPSFTSIGNNAKTAEAWLSPLTPSENYSPAQPDRKYFFPWTNQWYTSKCDPTNFATPQRNDVDAAIINLFAGHDRMHDFAYYLGFTEQNYNLQDDNFGNTQPGPYPAGRENDPELGNVQAGAVTGGAPSYEGRDNANQITLQDGIPPITNQYLFQPIAGAFYSPCVDGDFDTSVFGHEYTHAISNRMIGGPDSNITGDQGGAMGESWSDLDALEYLHAFGLVPTGGENPWSVGAYATGNMKVGIRNYALDDDPLNYSDVGYDAACNAPLVGPPVEPACASRSEVHSDGEIWNAVNYDIRQGLVTKYDSQYPESDQALQKACATGQRTADLCPGNRRWIQIVYDAFLLMQPTISMLDARDAYLGADVMRFGGANQKVLWHAFAQRGMGNTASTASADDPDPKPGFGSPVETNGTVNFSAVDEDGHPVKAKIFVGSYEAAVTPAADTDPASPLSNSLKLVPGTYRFVANAEGYGHVRLHPRTVSSGTSNITLHFATNWASKTKGGSASGDGGNFDDLIDDTEATDYAVVDADAVPDIQGKQVTVDLGGGAHIVDRVQVSAMLHPRDDADDYDNISQNRFTALRSFDIYTCNASVANAQCVLPTGFTKVGHFDNAFKASIPRPLVPQLLIRNFNVTNTLATHVRLVVLDNQCTGNPAYAGEQDNDPTNATDCRLASDQDLRVRIAELQAFSTSAKGSDTADPVVALTVTGPQVAAAGGSVAYSVGYRNLGPATSSRPTLRLIVPTGVQFVSASDGGMYRPSTRTVEWPLVDLAAGGSGSRSVSLRVDPSLPAGTIVIAEGRFDAPKTVASPAFAATAVS